MRRKTVCHGWMHVAQLGVKDGMLYELKCQGRAQRCEDMLEVRNLSPGTVVTLAFGRGAGIAKGVQMWK